MVTIRFCTTSYRPPRVVTLRTNLDKWDKHDIGGEFQGDSWYFRLNDPKYQAAFEFKFVLDHIHWMAGHLNQKVPANADAKRITYEEHQVHFERGPDRRNLLVEEDGWVRQRLLPPTIDDWREWDVIVIGSGMGGGIVAERLADALMVREGEQEVNKAPHVLVLEAGGYLVPQHVANLPRQHQIGRFDKHVWHLWDELQVRDYTNEPNSKYRGGQGINFGGRSVFWGGLIPRMVPWEFRGWPAEIKEALLHGTPSYYDLAEQTMSKHTAPRTPYQEFVKEDLAGVPALKGWAFEDAPSAIQMAPHESSGIAAGMFSTADLLMESRLTDTESNNGRLFVNLNHPVERIEVPKPATTCDSVDRVLTVHAHDRIADEERVYRAKRVVLAAGSLESPMVILRSERGQADANAQQANTLVGQGFTDHPVFYSHFGIPHGTTYAPNDEHGRSCKLVARYTSNDGVSKPFNILIEIGADLLHGRYVDRDIIAQQTEATKKMTLCEIVFVFEAPLVEQNRVRQGECGSSWPVISMAPCPVTVEQIDELLQLQDAILTFLGAKKLPGDPIHDEIVNNAAVEESDEAIPFCRARLGAAGHEVGSLRMGGDKGQSVVSSNLQVWEHENLYVCDLSVFPRAPASNPSLTLAALALRLADHLREEFGVPSAPADSGNRGQ